MMAAVSENNNVPLKKTLDFARGDVVYLRGDSVLRAGVGIIVHMERSTCDLYDAKEAQVRELNFNMPMRIPMILVYWVKSKRKMWMEDCDLYPLRKGIH